MKNKYLAVLAVLWTLCAGNVPAAPFAFIAESGGVDVVDVQTQAVIRNIPIAGTPVGTAVNPNGARAYVSNSATNEIAVIDTAAQAVIATIPVRGTTSGIALSPAGDKLFAVTHVGGTAVLSVIITDNLQTLAEVPLDSGAREALMHPQGTRVYVASRSSNRVFVVDATSHVVAATIALGGDIPVKLAIDGLGARLFVALDPAGVFLTGTRNRIAVVDLGTLGVVRTISVGSDNNLITGLAVNPGGNRLFAGGAADRTLSVIDLGSYSVIATVPLFAEPAGLDITPDGELVYVPVVSPPGLFMVSANTYAVARQIPLNAAPTGVGRFFGGPATAVPQSPDLLSGLWWNPAESGWGVHLTHRGNKIFAAWFTYDPQGVARWLVASDCSMSPPLLCRDCVQNAFCSGELYEVEGPTFFIDRYNPGAVRTRVAGVLQLTFETRDRARMSYAVGGRSRTVAIERQPIDVRPDVSPPVVNYTDLWWNPTESGWGLGITHQHGMMFLTWFVYDNIGRPVWYVASNCAVKATGSGCAGTLYRTSGPPGPAASDSFDASRVRVTAVGAIDVTFNDANSAVLTYSVDGVQGSKSIIRQIF